MGRYKSLALNTVIFGVCSFTSKLLVFFMLPFYTAVLSKEEFGTADLVTTVVSLIVPFFTLSISQGVMRFTLEKKNISEVFSFGLKVTIVGFLILLICYPVLAYIPIVRDYIFVFFLLYVTQAFQILISLFARGLNKVKLIGIAGVISSFVVVGANIILLFVFHCGIIGYLVSIIISNISFIVFLFPMCKMYLYVGGRNNKSLNKEMLAYSLPLIPNSLSWWIQHSVNRYILGYYCGVGDVGLYSVASKMPTIIDTFRGIFVQAWQLSSITEFEKNDSKVFFCNIYKLFNVFIIFLCTGLLLFCKIIARILYSDAFFEAWKLTPLLIVGILFSSLVAFYSPLYLAKKQTNKLFLSTASGAVMTIVCNLIFVPWIGTIGAAVSVVISNFIIFLYLHINSKRFLSFSLGSWQIFSSYAILLLQGVIITFLSCSPTGIWSLLMFAVIIVLNWRDVYSLIMKIKEIIKNKLI